jgi:ABC-2 type transport system ATP-binding protein
MNGCRQSGGWKLQQPAILIEKLTKKYGNLVAVDGLSLRIESGELFGLLGPNGAGKTTTLRICLDLLSRTSGEVTILGMDSHRDSVEIRRRTGYLPGEFGLIPNIRTSTYLAYLLHLSGVRSEGKMREMAERLDLDLSRKTHELSRGNRQKVGIVQALMADQDLVILDEPTTGIDPLVQQEFYRIVKEEHERGKTIFMSSHLLPEVEYVCDRVAIINEGRLLVLEKISTLQDKMGKILEVELRDRVDPDRFRIPGVSSVDVEGRRLRLIVMENLDAVIKILADHQIINMSLTTYSLEELFLQYYQTGKAANAGRGE